MWSNWFTKWTPRRKRRLPACRRRHSCTLVLQYLETRNLLSFIGPRNYDAGVRPVAVAPADFNGDGVPDLVIANQDTPPVSVLLGNGDGTFRNGPKLSGPGSFAAGVAVGDFEGNGIQDIAVSLNNGTVEVFLGNGDGSFQDARMVSTGANGAGMVVAADFTGDGSCDFAVATNLGVVVFLSNGDGTFQAPRNLGVNGAIVAGDFTGDGIADLAVSSSTNGLVIMLSNGDGSFRNAGTYLVGQSPDIATVGDFNGDGHLDLAVTPGIFILLGNGDGTFRVAGTTSVGGTAVVAGDVNGDGIADLLVDFPLRSGVAVLLGNGDGSFQFSQTIQNVGVSENIQPMALADFNGDGALDLAVVDGNDPLFVRLGNGDGSFQTATSYAAGTRPDAVVLGDFNGDGVRDLAVANEGSDDISVLLGNGDSSFAPAVNYSTGLNPFLMVMGDFNRDGNVDLVALDNSGHASILFGNGDGSFQSPVFFTTDVNVTSVVAADLTGDGILDLVLVSGGNTVSVLLGNGDGSFQAPVRYTGLGVNAASVAVGDVNGDGIPDLVVAYSGNPFPPRPVPGGISVLLGNGDGSFRNPMNDNLPGSSRLVAQSLALADLNGDGSLDVVTGNVVFLGNGDGSFGPAIYYGGLGGALAVGDFNGDGIPDIALATGDAGVFLFGRGDVQVFLGDGDGTFRADSRYATGQMPVALAMGDLNGDGLPDLIAVNYDSNNVSVLLNGADWDPQGQGMPARFRHSAREVDAALADSFWSSFDDDGGWEAWPVAPTKRPSMARLFRPPESTAATVVLCANRAVCLGPW